MGEVFLEVRGLLPAETGTDGSRLLEVCFFNVGMDVVEAVSRLRVGLVSLDDRAGPESGSAVSARPVMERGLSLSNAMSIKDGVLWVLF